MKVATQETGMGRGGVNHRALPRVPRDIPGVMPSVAGPEIKDPNVVALTPLGLLALAACGRNPGTAEMPTQPALGFTAESVPSSLGSNYRGFALDTTAEAYSVKTANGETYAFTVTRAIAPDGAPLTIRFAQYTDKTGAKQTTALWPEPVTATVNGNPGLSGIQFYMLKDSAIGPLGNDGMISVDLSRENLVRPLYSIFFKEGYTNADFQLAYSALLAAGQGNNTSEILKLINKYVNSIAFADPNAADVAEANRTAAIISYSSGDSALADKLVAILTGAQTVRAASAQQMASTPTAVIPTAVPATATVPNPTVTRVPTATAESTVVAPETRIGITADMTMADCNQLNFSTLDAQIATINTDSQARWAELGVTADNVYYFTNTSNGISRLGSVPWSYANLTIPGINPQAISCGVLHMPNGTDMLTLTIPMKIKGGTQIFPMTFALDEEGMKAWYTAINRMDGYAVNNTQTVFANLLKAILSGKSFSFAVSPWISTLDDNTDHIPEWENSNTLLTSNDSNGVDIFYRYPTLNEVPTIKVSLALNLLTNFKPSDYATPVDAALYADALIARLQGKVLPVEVLRVEQQ